MTKTMWPIAGLVSTFALLWAACQHPSEPTPKAAVAAPQTPKRSPQKWDEGESLAAVAREHRLGTPGPAMTLKTIDGETIDLAKLYGTKPVYLKFWATWCIPCREQMPAFERIYEAAGDRMQVIAINAGFSDDEAEVRAFREQYGLRMPIVIDDGRLAAALDLQVTPQHVLIGRDARIAYVGHRDGDPLDEAIQKVLAAPGPSGSTTGQAVVVRPAFRPGDLVQGLQATTSDGTAVALGPSRDGRRRGLVFFSTWCEGYLATSRPKTSQACRRVRDEVDRLAATGDIEWIGIAGGPWSAAKDVAAYQAKTKTKIPVALDADGALFRAFGVRQIPTVVLLDAGGRMVRLIGPDDHDLASAVRAR